MCWLRDDRGLFVKRHAIITETFIYLSLLPDGIGVQICVFMSSQSKTEITDTTLFLYEMSLLADIFSTFASFLICGCNKDN